MRKIEGYFIQEKKSIIGNVVNLVLRFRNNFNDVVIKDDVLSFYLDGNLIKALKKDYGYYVLSNLDTKSFKLDIKSHNYFTKHIDVNLENIRNEDICMDVFLIPHYKYVIAPSLRRFVGQVDPDTFIIATRFSNRTNIRYQSFDKNSKIIYLSNPADESIKGVLWAIIDYKNSKFETFFATNKISRDQYIIDSKLRMKFYESAPVQKAYISKSGDDGLINFYVDDNDAIDNQYILCYYKNNKKIYKMFDFSNLSVIEI